VLASVPDEIANAILVSLAHADHGNSHVR